MNRGRELVDIDVPARDRVELVSVRLPRAIAERIAPEQLENTGEPTSYAEVPFSGEWREEKGVAFPNPIAPSATTQLTVLTLSREWPMVGWGISPGNLPGGGGANQILGQLFALVRGQRVLIDSLAIVGGNAAAGHVVNCGARAELVMIVNTAGPSVSGIIASLWGSPFR